MLERKKKILLLTGIFPPDIGGPASYVPKLAAQLVQAGFVPTVVSYSDLPTYLGDNTLPFEVKRIARKRNWLLREIFSFIFILRQAWKAEVIMANGHFLKAALVGQILSRPVVAKVVGDEAWERAQNKKLFMGTLDQYQVSRKTWPLKFFDCLRMWPLQRMRTVIVPSHYLKKIVLGWGIKEEKIQVIYNGFSLKNLKHEKNKDNESFPTIVTVCRLVPWKGVAGIIDLLKSLEDVHLKIIGDGPLRQDLEGHARKIKVSERVHFLGHLNHHETLKRLSSGQVFVLNSSYEGLPHVALEALALGVPVVASDAGGTGEVVRNTISGQLYKLEDSQQMLSAVKKVLANDPHVEQMCILGKKMIENEFSETVMWEKTLACLSQGLVS